MIIPDGTVAEIVSCVSKQVLVAVEVAGEPRLFIYDEFLHREQIRSLGRLPIYPIKP